MSTLFRRSFVVSRRHLVPIGHANTEHATREFWLRMHRPFSTTTQAPTPRISLAPMMQHTNRHLRYLIRLISPRTIVYSEMEVAIKVVKQYELGNLQRLHMDLGFDERERPVVWQLGGNDPQTLARAVQIAEQIGWRYDEINLNCGCPSEAVSGAGAFGAKLMLDVDRVGRACAALRAATSVPVTVKCRIGVDDQDSYEFLANFVRQVSASGGISHFIIHARKALLKGLSPAANRTVPPLKYDTVYRLVKDFPNLHFTLNGGVTTPEQTLQHLAHGVHGVMIGRQAVEGPWIFREIDQALAMRQAAAGSTANAYEDEVVARQQVVLDYAKYAQAFMESVQQAASSTSRTRAMNVGELSRLTAPSTGASTSNGHWTPPAEASIRRLVLRPLLNILHGLPGANVFRRQLTDAMNRPKATPARSSERISAKQTVSSRVDVKAVIEAALASAMELSPRVVPRAKDLARVSAIVQG